MPLHKWWYDNGCNDNGDNDDNDNNVTMIIVIKIQMSMMTTYAAWCPQLLPSYSPAALSCPELEWFHNWSFLPSYYFCCLAFCPFYLLIIFVCLSFLSFCCGPPEPAVAWQDPWLSSRHGAATRASRRGSSRRSQTGCRRRTGGNLDMSVCLLGHPQKPKRTQICGESSPANIS